MIFAMKPKIGLPKQRSFWLRYFLACILGLVLCIAGAAALHAQLDLPAPERLTHVEGIIVDDTGRPAAELQVTLVRDEQIAYQTQTNRSGQFRIQHVRSGPYIFRVKRSGNAPAERQIMVTDEVVTALERKRLYVILGPGACQDACSSVLTSKRDFDKAIRKLSRH